MKKCENCGHWNKDEIRREYYGSCKKAVVIDNDDIKEPLPMAVRDGEGSEWCDLITHKDHCCKCWEKIIKT